MVFHCFEHAVDAIAANIITPRQGVILTWLYTTSCAPFHGRPQTLWAERSQLMSLLAYAQPDFT